MEGLKALENLKGVAIYEENNNMCSDLGDCCDFKGYLCEVYDEEIDAIEKELEDAKELDKHLDFSNGALMSGFDYKGQQIVAMPLEEYNKLMKKEIVEDEPEERVEDIVDKAIKQHKTYDRDELAENALFVKKALNNL